MDDKLLNSQSLAFTQKTLAYFNSNLVEGVKLKKEDESSNLILISDSMAAKFGVKLNDNIILKLKTNLKNVAVPVSFIVKGVYSSENDVVLDGKEYFANYMSDVIKQAYDEFPAYFYFDTRMDLLKYYYNEMLYVEYIFLDANNYYSEFSTLLYANIFSVLFSLFLIWFAIEIFFNLVKIIIAVNAFFKMNLSYNTLKIIFDFKSLPLIALKYFGGFMCASVVISVLDFIFLTKQNIVELLRKQSYI